MKHISISYGDLRGIDAEYVDELRSRESVVGRALERMGRQDASVRWLGVDDGSGNLTFKLLPSTSATDCIAQISPLDLTLASDELEQMLVEGKRPCSVVADEAPDMGRPCG